MAYSAVWDETKPAGTEARSLGDDRIRELKIQLREMLEEFLIDDMDADPVTPHPSLTYFDADTKMVFFQAAAPTGWTQDATYNDKTLRVVNGAGGGSGGSLALSAATVGDHILTTDEMPAHTHTYSGGGGVASMEAGGYFHNPYASTASGSAGGDDAHNHGLALAYIDVIICTKD